MPYPLLSRFYNPYGPVTTFALNGVQPPAAQYIGPSDQVQLTILSPNVGVTLMLGLRLLDLKGQVQPLQYKITTPATAATPFVEVITPGECFLLSATIGQANVRRGQCYCTLLLQRGQPKGGAAVGDVLISGYPSNTETLGFPQTPASSSLDGQGASLVYTGAVPAAGMPATITVPPGTRWNLLNASALITTTSIIQLHSPTLFVRTAGGDIKYIGNVQFYSFGASGTFLVAWSSSSIYFMPDSVRCNAGDVISADFNSAMVITDVYGALSVNVEEFAEI